MKTVLPDKASLRGKHNDPKFIFNYKKHNLRGRLNSIIALRLIDLNSLSLDNLPSIDEKGHLILDSENPLHRAWMED